MKQPLERPRWRTRLLTAAGKNRKQAGSNFGSEDQSDKPGTAASLLSNLILPVLFFSFISLLIFHPREFKLTAS